jgi:glycosyltransferase involved in cell wall biosynthesis
LTKATSKNESIYLIPWNDDPDKALRLASNAYDSANIMLLEKRGFREGKTLDQIRRFRQLSGYAVVLFFKSLEDINVPLLLPWLGIVHRCKYTILMDEVGATKAYNRTSLVWQVPRTLAALICDLATLAFSRFQFMQLRKSIQVVPPELPKRDFDFLYLFPGMGVRNQMGGAMSHVRGVLGGLREEGAKCIVLSAQPLPSGTYPTVTIPLPSRPFFFWEARALHYNNYVSKFVRNRMAGQSVGAIYQRHARFCIAGVLLARAMRVPLFLEYNGSETWIAKHWDPSRFGKWLDLCEQTMLQHASLIGVVSRPLYEELVEKGVQGERIVILPNGVDTSVFRPDCGGPLVRAKLGIQPDDIVIAFVGTFSYWHGISIMQEAVKQVLSDPKTPTTRRIHFLLIGEGPLRAEMSIALAEHIENRRVVFAGAVPHEQVPAYLDCADILLSPHTRMPDGKPFFGSPTKLFEYMAMGKGIIASDLDQIGQVLQHEKSALLVEPDSVDALCAAIWRLIDDGELRQKLGTEARNVACARYTWRRNANRLMNRIQAIHRPPGPISGFASNVGESITIAKQPRDV